jgi:hypothetical protein
MSDRLDRQFDEADAAVTQAVTRFASEIESMFGKWEAVAPPYIIENMLLELCTEVSKLAHEARVEPETSKLLDAMNDYQDV